MYLLSIIHKYEIFNYVKSYTNIVNYFQSFTNIRYLTTTIIHKYNIYNYYQSYYYFL